MPRASSCRQASPQQAPEQTIALVEYSSYPSSDVMQWLTYAGPCMSVPAGSQQQCVTDFMSRLTNIILTTTLGGDSVAEVDEDIAALMGVATGATTAST